MKQLLSQHDHLVLVGMKDRVFLIDMSWSSSSSSSTFARDILELSKPENASLTSPHQQQTQQPRRDKAELNDITAVAVTSFCTSPTESAVPTIFCAVARYDKTLAIYQLRRQDGVWKSATSSTNTERDPQLPFMVYHTPKRVGCLTFASLAASDSTDDNDNDYNTLQVLISGDLAGDAYAYNLQEKGHRLLLGHTASMLTGVTMLPAGVVASEQHHSYYYWGTCIATCDRDEKIRISRFPETYIIEGYLLGHTKYVTAMASVPASKPLLVSCSGDNMLRLWDWTTHQELCSISTTITPSDDQVTSKESLPTDLSVSADGKYVAVVFDGSKSLNVYKLSQETPAALSLCASVECPSQPLVVAFNQNVSTRLLVLMTEPHYLTGYTILEESENTQEVVLSLEENSSPLQALKEMAEKESISLPLTILEKDQQGHPVLAKENETRGLNFEQQPWKRVERIAIAKEKQKKRNQKKRDKKKQKLLS